MRNREGYLVTEEVRECTKCGTIFEKRSKTVTLCPPCNSSRVKKESAEKKMVRRAKGRAKDQQLPFNLKHTDIYIPTHCPALGIELYVTKGKSGAFSNSPSLDRLVPQLGYVRGNVQVISQQANQMKYNSTPDELIKFANWVIDTYGECNENN